MLFPIPAEALPRILLPLGDLHKDEVRTLAQRFGLPVHHKPESSDICFVPDRDYARVVHERLPEAFRPGEVRDRSGRLLGRHQGVPNFTVGQRRGLGVAAGTPIYVTEIDARTSTVIVGPRGDLLADALEASAMKWLGPAPEANRPVHAQIRYAHQAASARVHQVDADRWRVTFNDPQPAVTPGQAVVLHDQDIVLGGGWIDRAIKT